LNRQIILYLFLFFSFCKSVSAQQTGTNRPFQLDTIKPPIDTINRLKDSLPADTTVTDSTSLRNDSVINDARAKALADSLDVKKKKTEITQLIISRKKFTGEEYLFYSLLILLIFYAIMRLVFPKYFTDLFRVYLRTTLKQSQVREQLLQTPLPSLLLNGFFLISCGMYAGFLVEHFNLAPKFSFWQLWLYCSILLSIIYMMKYAGVWLAGWLFNRADAASSYIFIVFMTNKILGIVVLPFLVLLAFGTANIYSPALIISITLVACLFLYRFYLSIGVIRSQARVNLLHFFLYLLAFEALPLLILFKWVMMFIR
jgi:hypothetical protein